MLMRVAFFASFSLIVTQGLIAQIFSSSPLSCQSGQCISLTQPFKGLEVNTRFCFEGIEGNEYLVSHPQKSVKARIPTNSGKLTKDCPAKNVSGSCRKHMLPWQEDPNDGYITQIYQNVLKGSHATAGGGKEKWAFDFTKHDNKGGLGVSYKILSTVNGTVAKVMDRAVGLDPKYIIVKWEEDPKNPNNIHPDLVKYAPGYTGGPLYSSYFHVNGFPAGIQAGKKVKLGEYIADAGKTGNATGIHLHYQVQPQGDTYWGWSRKVLFEEFGGNIPEGDGYYGVATVVSRNIRGASLDCL